MKYEVNTNNNNNNNKKKRILFLLLDGNTIYILVFALDIYTCDVLDIYIMV